MEIVNDYFFWIVFFAIILVLFLIRILIRRPNFMRSKYEQTLEILSNENTESLLQEVMQKSGFKNVKLSSIDNKIYAITSFSMSSWFEFIEVKIISTNNNNLQLHFTSICGYPYQVYDWGKNKRNFECFKNELKRLKLLQQM